MTNAEMRHRNYHTSVTLTLNEIDALVWAAAVMTARGSVECIGALESAQHKLEQERDRVETAVRDVRGWQEVLREAEWGTRPAVDESEQS